MRKFIIRQFALNYTFKLFNRYWTALRASRIIFPLFVISGLLITYVGWNAITIFFSILTLISLFFGFIYFDFFPIKEEEYDILDEDQKKQYDYYKNLYK